MNALKLTPREIERKARKWRLIAGDLYKESYNDKLSFRTQKALTRAHDAICAAHDALCAGQTYRNSD